jgi:hypothetical protein
MPEPDLKNYLEHDEDDEYWSDFSDEDFTVDL